MIKNLNFKRRRQQLTRLAVALLLTGVSILANVFYTPFARAAQVTVRSITVDNSAGSATDVTYTVSFKAGTTHTIKGIVVQFCSNSPLAYTACTAPAGFDTNEAGLAIANQVGISGFTVDAATDTNTLVLVNAGGSAVTGGTTVVSFDAGAAGLTDGFTNPSTSNQTYYARIATYTTTAGATGYTDVNIDAGAAHTDDGGIALSTTNQITITSKVQETLTFCVYTGINCAAGGTAVALGDANGVLANTALVYTDNSSKFDLATNASAGAVVRLRGDTLKTAGGAFSIDPYGAVCTPDSALTNVEQFGVLVTSSGAPLVPIAPYNCSAGNHTFDVANTTGPIGQTIADTGGLALDIQTGTMEFAAKSALTTEAGIYTTTMTFIATATY